MAGFLLPGASLPYWLPSGFQPPGLFRNVVSFSFAFVSTSAALVRLLFFS
jgi:hypothetical protein